MHYSYALSCSLALLLAGCGGSSNDHNSQQQASFVVKSTLTVDTNEDTATTIDISAIKLPKENETPTFDLALLPVFGTVSGNYPTLTFTPHSDQYGSDSFSYTLQQDGQRSASVTVTINIQPVNDKAQFTSTPEISANIGEHYSFQPTISDVDTENDYRFEITNKPTWADFDTSTGQLSGTPTLPEHMGQFNGIVITLHDGEYNVTVPEFSIFVDAQPWQQLAHLPGFEGSHIQATAHNGQLFTLAHNYAWSSAMICHSAPAKAPYFSTLDINNGEWQSLTTPTLPRFYYQTQQVGGNIYLFGGTQACSSGSDPVTQMEIYDLASQQWQSVDSPSFTPSSQTITATCRSEQHIYAFTHNNDVNSLFTFDTATLQWQQTPYSAEPTQPVVSCAINGQVAYLLSDDTTSEQQRLTMLDLNTHATAASELIPQSESGNYADMTISDNTLYILTAKQLSGYALDTAQWQSFSANPYAQQVQDSTTYYLRDFQLVNDGSKLYSVGGAFTTQYERLIFQYDKRFDSAQ